MKQIYALTSATLLLGSCGGEPPTRPAVPSNIVPTFQLTSVPPSLPTPMPSSTGDTLYVSPNGNDAWLGTASNPWRSIQKAFKALKPNQIAVVASGTYGAKCSTTTYSDTTWTGQPKTLLATGADTVLGQVRLYGRGLRISGFVFVGPTCGDWLSSSGQIGQNILQFYSSAAYIEISNSEVYHSGWHAGINTYGSYVWILNNYIHNNGNPLDTNQYNTSHGIYVGPSYYNVIQGNVITANRAKGISGRYDAGPGWILDNQVTWNGRYGVNLDSAAHSWDFERNYAAYNGRVNGGVGINVSASVGPDWITSNTFKCNGPKGTGTWLGNAQTYADSTNVVLSGC